MTERKQSTAPNRGLCNLISERLLVNDATKRKELRLDSIAMLKRSSKVYGYKKGYKSFFENGQGNTLF